MNQTSIKIRKAVEEDCPQLLTLVRELATYERAPDAVTISLEQFKESGFGEHPIWWAFVAEEPQQIIGFALFYLRFSTWKGPRMYLEDIIVTEAYRGRGIGYLLMQQLIQEASEKQLDGIQWQVLEWNEPAINFYKKFNASFDPEWWNASLDLHAQKQKEQ